MGILIVSSPKEEEGCQNGIAFFCPLRTLPGEAWGQVPSRDPTPFLSHPLIPSASPSGPDVAVIVSSHYEVGGGGYIGITASVCPFLCVCVSVCRCVRILSGQHLMNCSAFFFLTELVMVVYYHKAEGLSENWFATFKFKSQRGLILLYYERFYWSVCNQTLFNSTAS